MQSMRYEESWLGAVEGSGGCWPFPGKPHYLKCYYPLGIAAAGSRTGFRACQERKRSSLWAMLESRNQ